MVYKDLRRNSNRIGDKMARGKIKINNGTIELEAKASTRYRFQQVFGEDLLYIQSKIEQESASDKELYDYAEKLAYIMNMQADGEINGASIDGFFEWLDKFDPGDLIQNFGQILGIYYSNAKTRSKLKNQDAPQSEK